MSPLMTLSPGPRVRPGNLKLAMRITRPCERFTHSTPLMSEGKTWQRFYRRCVVSSRRHAQPQKQLSLKASEKQMHAGGSLSLLRHVAACEQKKSPSFTSTMSAWKAHTGFSTSKAKAGKPATSPSPYGLPVISLSNVCVIAGMRSQVKPVGTWLPARLAKLPANSSPATGRYIPCATGMQQTSTRKDATFSPSKNFSDTPPWPPHNATHNHRNQPLCRL